MFQGQTSLGGERLVSTTTTTPPTKPAALSAAKQALEKETAALHIPICGILAGGDRCSLHQVFAVMTSNHCPMVVIRCLRDDGAGSPNDMRTGKRSHRRLLSWECRWRGYDHLAVNPHYQCASVERFVLAISQALSRVRQSHTYIDF
ncbi:unnamed protein product [Mesocestoides corti]|uniref:Uncharacterized protein n=1 Tax=Mesocestoides corti TaxID=53468 RepID=A0A0R3UA99_MESCO|nr:unnamed protein product [Mesocestoides corti]